MHSQEIVKFSLELFTAFNLEVEVNGLLKYTFFVIFMIIFYMNPICCNNWCCSYCVVDNSVAETYQF